MPESPLPRVAALFAAATAWGAAVSVREGVTGEPLRLRARGSLPAQLACGCGSGLSAPWPMVAAVVADALRARVGRPAGRVSAVVGLGLLAGVAVEPVTWGRRQRSAAVASTVVVNVTTGVLLVATGRAQWRRGRRAPVAPARGGAR